MVVMHMEASVMYLGAGLCVAFGALVTAFVSHFVYQKRIENANRKGYMRGLAVSGWVTRETKKVSLKMYEDLMDFKIGGILPISDTVDEALGGILSKFHREMMRIYKSDPQRFLDVLTIIAPTLCAIQATSRKITLGNIPNIIKSVGKLIGDFKTLAKFMPKPPAGETVLKAEPAAPTNSGSPVSPPAINPLALLSKVMK